MNTQLTKTNVLIGINISKKIPLFDRPECHIVQIVGWSPAASYRHHERFGSYGVAEIPLLAEPLRDGYLYGKKLLTSEVVSFGDETCPIEDFEERIIRLHDLDGHSKVKEALDNLTFKEIDALKANYGSTLDRRRALVLFSEGKLLASAIGLE